MRSSSAKKLRKTAKKFARQEWTEFLDRLPSLPIHTRKQLIRHQVAGMTLPARLSVALGVILGGE